MQEYIQGEYSLADHGTNHSLEIETDTGDSMIVSVPTILRQDNNTERETFDYHRTSDCSNHSHTKVTIINSN